MLRILHLEDNTPDSDMVERELRKTGLSFLYKRSENVTDFAGFLRDFVPDIVLANHHPPEIDGIGALNLVLDALPGVPFIVVTGSIREETVVEAMQAGATDCISKDRIGRLGSAVIRALREGEEHAERIRAEAAQHESEARFRAMFDHAAIGIAIVDPSGQGIFSNRALRDMLGYDELELVRLNITDYVHPDDLKRDLDLFRELTEGKRLSYQVEQRHIKKDGETMWARLAVSLVRDKGGAALFAVRMLEDISHQKALQDQLRQVDKMDAMGRMAGGVAHDFNNILTAVLGFSELALDQTEAGKPLHGMLLEIRNAGERAKSLVAQLMAFSRKQTLELKVLDLNAELEKTLAMLRRVIGDQVELKTHLSRQPCHIRADRTQLEQVVVNLVVNARDAMPRGGTLTIGTSYLELTEPLALSQTTLGAGHYVTLSVTDSGSGMSPETLAHIFEPFFTTKGIGKGTGLGLATVYGIVRQSNAAIQVDSREGQGTVFRVHFPRVVDPEHHDESHETTSCKIIRGTETILIAEDDNAVRVLAFELLKRQGYKVLEAGCGTEALRIARSHPGPIHLLLTDLGMPQMSGPDLAVRLRELRPATRILFMSGHSSDELGVKTTLPAGTLFLEKPFTSDLLGQAVRDALDRTDTDNTPATR